MKKILLLVAAVLSLSTSATFAQKVDVDGIKAKLAKVDADTAHPKKGLKAAAWISRGDAYAEALMKPTESLYLNADYATISVLCGAGKDAGKVTMGSREMDSYNYPYFTLYVVDGKVVAWTEKANKAIYAGAIDEALKSYAKAMELDSNSILKVKKGLDALVNYYKQQGNLAIEISYMKAGAAAYTMVADIQAAPGYEAVDSSMLFYAGYMYTIDGDEDATSFAKGEAALNRALEAGYDKVEDANKELSDKERGNIYYYLFHCAYGARDIDPSKLQAAKGYLEAGITKYPANEKIFEGLLQLYTTEEGMGDPSELLETIEKTIAADPTNFNSWFGRGRIYFALKNYDECIKSFEKVVEIDPSSFEGNYYLGLFHMIKGDEFLDSMNSKTYTDQNSLNADVVVLNTLYGNALPYFEAAHALKPKDESTLEYLKQLCFRLRDEPGIMDKYNKYNELFKAL
ncbi:MAG: tetratricopeptide repeat protein [Rikenellaceae bacterium]